MLASQTGDDGAHRKLLGQLSGYLRAYFKRRLAQAGGQQAEDLVQETLLAIHSHRHMYNAAQPFTPWVYAIARYKLIDYFRAAKPFGADVPIEEADEVLAEDDRAEVESAFDLEKLLALLPAKARQSIQYVKLDGLSVAEAATRSGMSESAVKVSIHRGLKALSALMSRESKL